MICSGATLVEESTITITINMTIFDFQTMVIYVYSLSLLRITYKNRFLLILKKK